MNQKAFSWGARVGAMVCDTVPYAFFAGIFYGFAVYVNRVAQQAEQAQRQADWKKRVDDSTWRPGEAK